MKRIVDNVFDKVKLEIAFLHNPFLDTYTNQ